MPNRPYSFYRTLFVVCLVVLVTLALPGRWNRLASPGYLLLAITMIAGLGQAGREEARHSQIGRAHV